MIGGVVWKNLNRVRFVEARIFILKKLNINYGKLSASTVA
jgi:hypothetical protein